MKANQYFSLTAVLVILCVTSCKTEQPKVVQPKEIKSIRVNFVINNGLVSISPEDTMTIQLQLYKRLKDDTTKNIAFDTSFSFLEKNSGKEIRISKEIPINPKTENLYTYESCHLNYKNYTQTVIMPLSTSEPVLEETFNIFTYTDRHNWY